MAGIMAPSKYENPYTINVFFRQVDFQWMSLHASGDWL